jgi:hypothetical protein
LSAETTGRPEPATLAWAARVWSRLTSVECAGVLYVALRYNPDIQHDASARYIDSMSLLPWLSLGEPLQLDIARALDQLRRHLAS